MWPDVCAIDTSLVPRAVTFENPTAAPGAGGRSAGGRKGAPSRQFAPGERVVLADIEGPGTIRHVWMKIEPSPPEVLRGFVLEVFYDGADEPSVSVPCLDFFGLPHGRPAPYASLLTTAQEGRGFNSYVPMPFGKRARLELVNGSALARHVYFQVDFTLGPVDPSYLHVSFRRENPTTLLRDFPIAAGLEGPGRFLGCVVGVRPLDPGVWYGEGEVKVYIDGDGAHPTICGTGLEDYVGTAWGMGVHHAPFAGAPMIACREDAMLPDFVAFYRWHVPDPVVFERELRVDLQQIGAVWYRDRESLDSLAWTRPLAGEGALQEESPEGTIHGGLVERVDDVCAAAFVYCRTPQPVPPVNVAAAVADLELLDYEAMLDADTLHFVMP
jgi:hypothetical protein